MKYVVTSFWQYDGDPFRTDWVILAMFVALKRWLSGEVDIRLMYDRKQK